MEIIAPYFAIAVTAVIAFLAAKLQDALRQIRENAQRFSGLKDKIEELEKANQQLTASARHDRLHRELQDSGEQMAFNLARLEEDYQIQGERIKFMKRIAGGMMNEHKPDTK